MKRLVVFFLLFSSSAFAGDTLTVGDTAVHHSIRKAILFSAVIPGAGQIYNHRAMPKGQKKAFWKVPLIYAALGTSTFFLIRNEQQQKYFRCEYEKRQFLTYNSVNNILNYDADLAVYDDQGILTLYNQYLNWRDLSILAVGAFYFLQLVDAGVEAHFVSFDVSEDLSLTVDPVILATRTPGLSLCLNFH
jgi:hypothetical protein